MKCPECAKGIIKKVIVKNYKAKLKGITFLVKNAEIGKCDNCCAELYNAKEIRRWESILNKKEKKWTGHYAYILLLVSP